MKMTRWLTAMAAALLLSSSAAVAVAEETEAPKADVKTKFYNFDDMLIDGEIKKPSGLLTNARDQVKFQRLLSLKKSFLPKLKSTAKEQAFK